MKMLEEHQTNVTLPTPTYVYRREIVISVWIICAFSSCITVSDHCTVIMCVTRAPEIQLAIVLRYASSYKYSYIGDIKYSLKFKMLGPP
jgi:hypothetical protein